MAAYQREQVAGMNGAVTESSQAAAMLRRVSPEGRARALREQQRRRRARMRLLARGALATLLIAIVLAAVASQVSVPPAGFVAALCVLVLAWIAIAYASRQPRVTAERLGEMPLATLPQSAGAWLEAQRPALPAPAAQLADGIGVRLETLSHQLAGVDPNGPAGEAVRKLVAVELPNLIDRYGAIPASARHARDGREGADAHLVRGLGIVDAEIARMTEQLASGSFDALATQHRYLELKYDECAPGA